MSTTASTAPPPQMYIGGEWVTGTDLHPVFNPADESVVGEVPYATADDAARALEAARAAQPSWAKLSMVERGAVLRAIAQGIREHAEDLAHLVVREQGKTITEARGEIGGTAGFFDYYATFERSQIGAAYAPDGRGEQLLIRRVPYGVVVGIIPWNFPAALFARKVAPAIMAGNAIVLKPSEETPLTALALARIVERAGTPPGVVNVVTGLGREVGDALVRHPVTQLVTVTGSVRAGREILAASAEHITTVSLELGGKAPFVVLSDADVDRAIDDAVQARLWNCGQVCTCNERTYVHESLFDRFVEGFVERARAVRLGDPMDETTEMGPKVSANEVAKVQKFVDDAVSDGAEVHLGGNRPSGSQYQKGHWFEPTVLTGTRNDMDIVQNEVFGPVLPIMPFADVDEAFALANDSRYGLTAYVYTSDLKLAMRAVDEVHAGEVYINRVGPEQVQGFHGGYGLSGLGGDDGEHGFDRYHRRKTVYLRYE